MASQWFLKTDDAEAGPYSFADLVDLVRTETISDATLLRPDWSPEWQRANTVIGLFHMARRAPEAVPARAELAGPEQVVDEPVPSAEPAPPRGWMKRFQELIRNAKPRTGVSATRHVSEDNQPRPELLAEVSASEPPTSPTVADIAPLTERDVSVTSGLTEAIEAATACSETRNKSGVTSARVREPRKIPLWEICAGVTARLVLGIICAMLLANHVGNWSDQESLRQKRVAYLLQRQVRFGARGPDPRVRGGQADAPAVHYIPYLGGFSRGQYSWVLAGLGVVVCLVIYVASLFLELAIIRLLCWRRGRFA